MKTSIDKKAALLSSIIGLSACGGGTSSASFSELQQNYFQATDSLSFNGSGVPANQTPLSGVPTSESKTYSGPIALIVRPTGQATDITLSQANLQSEGMIGQITLTANFAANGGTLDGSATNFVRSDNSAVAGTLTLSSTVLDRVTPDPGQVSYSLTQFSGTLTGTPIGTANLNGVSTGGFANPDAALWGVAQGNANGANAAFNSTFVAAEN